MTARLCAVGDLIEDVVVRPAGPIAHGTDTPVVTTRHRGGSAANVAVAAAHLVGLARFVGQVGDDPLGDRLVAGLERVGVEPAVRRGGRTGSIVVLVDPDDGERTMLTDRGASPQLDHADPAWLDGVDVLHLPAYSLCSEPIGTTARTLAVEARRRGALVSVDASSASVLHGYGFERFLTLLTELRPDVLFASADEAAVLGLADDHLPTGVGVLVVKRGAEPTLVVTGDGTTRHPVPPVEVVDTTGAGDAFAAGFLLSFREHGDLAAAVAAGQAIAARTVSDAGAEAYRTGQE